MRIPTLKKKPDFENMAEKLKSIPGAEEMIRDCILLFLSYDPSSSLAEQLEQLYLSYPGNDLLPVFVQTIGFYPADKTERAMMTAEEIVKLIYS